MKFFVFPPQRLSTPTKKNLPHSTVSDSIPMHEAYNYSSKNEKHTNSSSSRISSNINNNNNNKTNNNGN